MTEQPQSAADRLRELKGLHEEGLISDDEFEDMRTPLLSEMGHSAASTAVDSEPLGGDFGSQDVEELPDIPDRSPVADDPERLSDSPISGRQFSIIAVVVAIVVGVFLAATNFRTIEHWAFPERLAYDTGVESFHMRNAAGTGMSCAYLEEVKDAVGADRAKAGEVVDDLNVLLFDAAALVRTTGDLAYDADHDQFFVSGVWDEATRTCPDAFDTPTIVGRP